MGEILDPNNKPAEENGSLEPVLKKKETQGKVVNIEGGYKAKYGRKIENLNLFIDTCVQEISELHNDLLDQVQAPEHHIIREKLNQKRKRRDALIAERNRLQQTLNSLNE